MPPVQDPYAPFTFSGVETQTHTPFIRSLICASPPPELAAKSLLPEIVESVDQNYETEVTEVRELGSGGFATVYLARWRGQEVAVKKMKGDNVGIDQFEEFCQEMTLMRYALTVCCVCV